MDVSVKTLTNVSSDLGLFGIQFNFTLDDNTDKTFSISTNAGNHKVQLKANFCNFYFPLLFKLPHPDLCAFAALKIISPFIGDTFNMDRGVSVKMAEYIKKTYPKISTIKVDNTLLPFLDTNRKEVAISFSGGVDSVAAATLMGKKSILIMTARTEHPDIGEYESWNNPRAQIKTLKYMPYNYPKILVYTDFPYLCVNDGDNYCVYPDSYSFTIPSILLAEKLNIRHIITGDILAGFTGNETTYTSAFRNKGSDFFEAVGVNLDYPCNGVTELITTKIAKENGLLEISSACEYGDFMKPCMKCIKCFRKSIYKWALFDEALTEESLERFNNSPSIIKFANDNGRSGKYFLPSYRFCFEKIDYQFKDNIRKIYERSMSFKEPTTWVDKKNLHAYKNRDLILANAIADLNKYASDMLSVDYEFFKQLNWNKKQ